MSIGFIVFLAVIISSLWVLLDAKSIGIKKGQVEGITNMGPWGWFCGCLLLWIVIFPLYLEKRGTFKKINGKMNANEKDNLSKYAGWIFIGVVVVLSALSFLSKSAAPACGDEVTKNLVVSIFMKEAKKQVRENSELMSAVKVSDKQWDENWKEIAPKIAVHIENIRIKSFNKDVGSYVCAADLFYKFQNQEQMMPIVYSSELSVDKPGGFYVEVSGIR